MNDVKSRFVDHRVKVIIEEEFVVSLPEEVVADSDPENLRTFLETVALEATESGTIVTNASFDGREDIEIRMKLRKYSRRYEIEKKK